MNILYIFYLAGVIGMLTVLFMCGKQYGLSNAQIILLAVSFGVIGYPSVKLMFLLENGVWGGLSFFGAVFFAPVFIIPFVLILKIGYKDSLDLLVSGGILINGVMKINCFINGCCYGIVMSHAADGSEIRFPSQLVEMAVSFAICILMITLIRKGKCRGIIYPMFLVIYGIARFVLNYLRETEDVLVGLSIGNIWSLVAAIIGSIWLLVYFSKKNNAQNA